MGKGGTVPRGFGTLGLHAGQTLGGTVVGGGVQTLLHTALITQPRGNRTGQSVVGSSSVQSFEISSPGSDGFTITLPGNPLLPWQGTLRVRLATPSSGVVVAAKLGGALATPNNGSDTTPVSSSDVATFYGGDEVTCEAVLSGATGGPYAVTIDFGAIRLS